MVSKSENEVLRRGMKEFLEDLDTREKEKETLAEEIDERVRIEKQVIQYILKLITIYQVINPVMQNLIKQIELENKSIVGMESVIKGRSKCETIEEAQRKLELENNRLIKNIKIETEQKEILEIKEHEIEEITSLREKMTETAILEGIESEKLVKQSEQMERRRIDKKADKGRDELEEIKAWFNHIKGKVTRVQSLSIRELQKRIEKAEKILDRLAREVWTEDKKSVEVEVKKALKIVAGLKEIKEKAEVEVTTKEIMKRLGEVPLNENRIFLEMIKEIRKRKDKINALAQAVRNEFTSDLIAEILEMAERRAKEIINASEDKEGEEKKYEWAYSTFLEMGVARQIDEALLKNKEEFKVMKRELETLLRKGGVDELKRITTHVPIIGLKWNERKKMIDQIRPQQRKLRSFIRWTSKMPKLIKIEDVYTVEQIEKHAKDILTLSEETIEKIKAGETLEGREDPQFIREQTGLIENYVKKGKEKAEAMIKRGQEKEREERKKEKKRKKENPIIVDIEKEQERLGWFLNRISKIKDKERVVKGEGGHHYTIGKIEEQINDLLVYCEEAIKRIRGKIINGKEDLEKIQHQTKAAEYFVNLAEQQSET